MARTPNPISPLRSLLTAGNSGFSTAWAVFTLECARIAISTLLRVWLKIQVRITAIDSTVPTKTRTVAADRPPF